MAHPKPKPRKRSTRVHLVLAGTAGLTVLAGCEEDRIDTAVFPNVEACRADAGTADSWWTPAECDDAFAQAMATHAESAPRYADAQLCREEHAGACVEDTANGSTGAFFPLVAGYMIGRAMTGGGVAPQPLYSTRQGKFTTASGAASFDGNRGTTALRQSAFTAPKSTRGVAPMTRASVAQTGGFGASRSAAGGTRAGG